MMDWYVPVAIFFAGMGVSGLIAWGILITKVDAHSESIKKNDDCAKETKTIVNGIDRRLFVIENSCVSREKHCGNDISDLFRRVGEIEHNYERLKTDLINGVLQTFEGALDKAIKDAVKDGKGS